MAERSAGSAIHGYPVINILSEELGSKLEQFPSEYIEPLAEWSEENEGGWLALLEMIDQTLIDWWNSAAWEAEEYSADIALKHLQETGEIQNYPDLAVSQMVHIPAKAWLKLKEEADGRDLTVAELVIKRLANESGNSQ